MTNTESGQFYFDDSRYRGLIVNRRWFTTMDAAVDRAALLNITGLGATRGVYAKDGTLVADGDKLAEVGWARYADQVDIAWEV